MPRSPQLSLTSDPDGYRQWPDAGMNDMELANIRLPLKQARALGDHRFQAMVEKALGRPATTRPLGRPRRMALSTEGGSI